MIDPRASIIEKRLSGVRRILVFGSAKGGVGKSACATTSALIAARSGLRCGLLDLDFQGAACHLFLGSSPGFPEEDGGILPHRLTHDLRFLSIASFTGDEAVPMRGADLSNALVELLCVGIWGNLDLLVIDMPPGIGDQILDLLRYVPRVECVVVTTPSAVAARVANRLLDVLQESPTRVAGVLVNMMRDGETSPVGPQTTLLGTIPYDSGLESAIGSPEGLMSGRLGQALDKALRAIEPSIGLV